MFTQEKHSLTGGKKEEMSFKNELQLNKLVNFRYIDNFGKEDYHMLNAFCLVTRWSHFGVKSCE